MRYSHCAIGELHRARAVIDDPLDEAAAPRRARRFLGPLIWRGWMLDGDAILLSSRPRDTRDAAIDAMKVDLALVGVRRMADDVGDRAKRPVGIRRIERLLA